MSTLNTELNIRSKQDMVAVTKSKDALQMPVSLIIFPFHFSSWGWPQCEVFITVITQYNAALYSLQSFFLQIISVKSHSFTSHDPMGSIKLTISARWPGNLLELIG